MDHGPNNVHHAILTLNTYVKRPPMDDWKEKIIGLRLHIELQTVRFKLRINNFT